MSLPTTSATFSIPASGSTTGSVLVSDSTQAAKYSNVVVCDGTHAVFAQIVLVPDSTHYEFKTLAILAGSSGNTMASGASIFLMSQPASALPNYGGGASLTDEILVSQNGNYFKAPLSDYLASSWAPVASLHAQQQTIGSIIHQWRCNDAAGSSTLADSVGSTALTVTGSSMQVGVKGLMNDGATAVSSLGAAGNYLTASSVVPTSGAWCIEILAAVPFVLNNNAFGIISAPGTGGAGTGTIAYYEIDGSSISSTQALTLGVFNVSSVGTQYTFGIYPLLFHLESDGSANNYLSVNGVQVATDAHYVTPSGVIFIAALSATQYPGPLVVQNIAVYNARLSSANKILNAQAVVRN